MIDPLSADLSNGFLTQLGDLSAFKKSMDDNRTKIAWNIIRD